MAIGLSKVFGFDIKENFNYPYMAVTIKDFWRRWHISLSNWFRDYIYIPLGGSRKGRARTYVNTLIVFIVTGLWHGANWTFWFWGVYHGVLQILESCFWGKYLKKLKIVNIVYMNFIVVLGWVFFRADSINYALTFIKNMLQYKAGVSNFRVINYINTKVIIVLIIGIVFAGIIQFWIGKLKEYIKFPCVVIEISKGALLMGILFFSLMEIACGTYNSFIYFQF